MIRLADQFFEVKSDPAQISVNEETMEMLAKIHPRTMGEKTNENGPIAWILVIPTTRSVMEDFIAKKINEKELLARTPLNGQYKALYLCSALVLPEFRGMGLAKNLLLGSITEIRKVHPLEALFYWSFSPEGKGLATSIAKEVGLPLFQRGE